MKKYLESQFTISDVVNLMDEEFHQLLPQSSQLTDTNIELCNHLKSVNVLEF